MVAKSGTPLREGHRLEDGEVFAGHGKERE
jgi:hypothetical protein